MMENKLPRDIIEENLLAQGMDVLVVEKFITVLDPTSSSQVLQMVWGSFKKIDHAIKRADIPAAWRDIYQCVVAIGRTPLFDDESKASVKVIHGHITKHPLFSTLAYQASDLDQNQQLFYSSLQFLLLCAAIEAHDTGEQVSLSAIHKACLLARQLFQPQDDDINVKLSVIFCTFEPDDDDDQSPLIQRFLALSDHSLVHKGHSFFGSKFSALKTVITIIAGYKSLRQKREHKTSPHALNDFQVNSPLIFSDDPDDSSNGSQPTMVVIDTDIDEETEYESQVIDGGAPNEVKSPRVQIKASLPHNIAPQGLSPRQFAYRQKGMIDAIAQRNQGLVYDISRLQRTELTAVLDLCYQALTALEQTSSSGFQNGFSLALDTQLAILLLLLTGMPLSRLLDIMLVKENLTNQLHLKTTADGSQILISFVPAKHRLTHINPQKFSSLVYSPSLYIELTVGDAFYPLLKLVLQLKKRQGLSWGKPIISIKEADLEPSVQQQLSVWNKSINAHLSIHRLSRWLEQVVYDYSGDLAACYYLSNSSTYKPAQAYYVNFDHQYLADIYQQVTSMSYLSDGNKPLNIANRPTELTSGSLLAVKCANMPKVVTALIGLVAKVGSPILADKIAVHNGLVCYIYWMFAFGVGLRSVKDPLESINNVDLHSGVLLLNDKENRSVANCRYVILPDLLRQQIQAYLDHLSVFCHILSVCDFTLHQKVRSAMTGKQNTPLLFFINPERLTYQQVTPKRLAQHLKETFPMPLNIGRHYLRSELVRRHCPAYWIDMLLGHAEIRCFSR